MLFAKSLAANGSPSLEPQHPEPYRIERRTPAQSGGLSLITRFNPANLKAFYPRFRDPSTPVAYQWVSPIKIKVVPVRALVGMNRSG